MSKLLSIAFGCAFFSIALCGAAGAQQSPSEFQGVLITPIRLFLDASEPTGDMTVRNSTGDVMRFQVDGFAWRETIGGKTDLTPSPDLIFYPTIFTLAPGTSQLIRIGIQGSPTPSERTFRLLVTALPPPVLPGQLRSTAVQVNEQYSVPIFVQPQNATSRLEAQRAEIAGEKLSLYVRNAGTSYDLVHVVTITGLSATGASLFTSKAAGWYLLADSRRVFTFAVPRSACAAVRSVRVVATSEKDGLNATLPVEGTCR